MQVQFLALLCGLRIQGCLELRSLLLMQLEPHVAEAVASAGSCSSLPTPGLGTSVCCRCSLKKKKEKKRKKGRVKAFKSPSRRLNPKASGHVSLQCPFPLLDQPGLPTPCQRRNVAHSSPAAVEPVPHANKASCPRPIRRSNMPQTKIKKSGPHSGMKQLYIEAGAHSYLPLLSLSLSENVPLL